MIHASQTIPAFAARNSDVRCLIAFNEKEIDGLSSLRWYGLLRVPGQGLRTPHVTSPEHGNIFCNFYDVR